MSSRELERVEVMGRVASGNLKLTDAAVMLELSYRQTKRLWRCYRQVGRKGLKHGNAGRLSNRSKPQKLRRRVLNLIKKKYSGSEDEEIRADSSGRTLGRGRRHCDGSRDLAPLDVGGTPMEPAAEAQETLPTPGAQIPLWRIGAIGRQFS
jgi:hypothetical protein